MIVDPYSVIGQNNNSALYYETSTNTETSRGDPNFVASVCMEDIFSWLFLYHLMPDAFR